MYGAGGTVAQARCRAVARVARVAGLHFFLKVKSREDLYLKLCSVVRLPLCACPCCSVVFVSCSVVGKFHCLSNVSPT